MKGLVSGAWIWWIYVLCRHSISKKKLTIFFFFRLSVDRIRLLKLEVSAESIRKSFTRNKFFSLLHSLSLSLYLYLSIYPSTYLIYSICLSFYLSKCHSFLISSLSFYKPIHLIHVNHLTWSIRSDSLFAPPSSRSSPTIVFSSARALSRSDASFFPFVLTIPWKHIQKSNVQF